MRSNAALTSAEGGEGRVAAAAAALVVGALVAALTDPGVTLPDNIRHNARERSAFRDETQAATAENERRREALALTLRLTRTLP